MHITYRINDTIIFPDLPQGCLYIFVVSDIFVVGFDREFFIESFFFEYLGWYDKKLSFIPPSYSREGSIVLRLIQYLSHIGSEMRCCVVHSFVVIV